MLFFSHLMRHNVLTFLFLVSFFTGCEGRKVEPPPGRAAPRSSATDGGVAVGGKPGRVVFPGRVSPAVRTLARLDAAVPAETRRRQLARLPETLSAAEVAALTNLLAAAEGRIGGVTPGEALALKNDVMNALLLRAGGIPGLAPFFAAQALDTANGRGWRDYAVQALPELHARAPSGEERRAVEETFRAIFAEPRLRPFRGTALNGLAAAERAGDPIPDLPLRDAALAVLRDPRPDNAALLTAIALCRKNGWEEAAPEISRLARTAADPVVRRCGEAAGKGAAR